MAVKRCEANIDVVKAAEIRIKNVFGNGLPVFFSFSGGKDSLCVAQLMVNLANRGEIDMKQLTVQFVKMNEYYPDLMERIIRREPNAYLAALYWDSEMFGRSSRKRKEAEEGQEQRDYRQELIHLFNHMDVFFDTPHKRHVAERYRNFFMAVSAIATSADCKHIYEGLISGDPKMRAFRALYQRVYGRYINDAKKGEHHGQ